MPPHFDAVVRDHAFLLPFSLADNYESAHTFSDFANWLVPGTLLVGRYPYVEPSRCKTYQQGEQKLDQILKAGITTFMSLQVRELRCCLVKPLVNCRGAVCGATGGGKTLVVCDNRGHSQTRWLRSWC
jgi:hypothetical protein